MDQPLLKDLLGPTSPTTETLSVRAICASTLNGSATVDGRSKALGNDLDGKLLNALRDWCDVVLVGAETVRSENYFGVQPTENSPVPARMAVVTASMEFHWDKQFFYNYFTPHIFLVPDNSLSDSTKKPLIHRLEKFGDVHNINDGNPQNWIDTLKHLGFKRILCEGGPAIFGGLIASNAVDQFYLTLDPTLSSAVESPITRDTSDRLATQNMHLESVQSCPDSTIFLRYGRGDS